jgi:MYXO-CTERM domain-containing protein
VVGVEAGGLPPGDHTGELRLFAPPDETEPAVVVPVTLTVQEGIVVVPDTSEGTSEEVGEDTGGSVSEEVSDSGSRPDAWQEEDQGAGTSDIAAHDTGADAVQPAGKGKSGGCAAGTTGPGPFVLLLVLALLPVLRRRASCGSPMRS